MFRRLFFFAAIVAVASSLDACAIAARQSSHAEYVTAAARLEALRRAQVWQATDIPSMDLRAGPKGPGAFPPGASVTCTYLDKKLNGRSPKFACTIPPDDELKVKYGTHNGEVYAEVAASRLFWALGFGAERMYPVSVVCQGCPSNLQDTKVAAIERKMPGKDIEVADGSGWAWPELDLVDPAVGGAPRAQRDALKLLAVFVQHTDSKPEQQRLICLGQHETNKKPCAEPFMMAHDLGQTFGQANAWNRSSVSSVNLDEWGRAAIWKDRGRCIAGMKKSFSGTLGNPKISEEGRKFLADLLVQLTDAQLHDLFTVARFPQRWESPPGSSEAQTIDQWVNAFKRKRDEVVNNTCQP